MSMYRLWVALYADGQASWFDVVACSGQEAYDLLKPRLTPQAFVFHVEKGLPLQPPPE